MEMEQFQHLRGRREKPEQAEVRGEADRDGDRGEAQREVNVGDTVILNGSGSDDLDNDSLTYQWEFNFKPVNPVPSLATIDKPTNEITFFVPDVGGDYFVKLTVSDGTDVDDVTVHITAIASDSDPVAIISYSPPAVNQGVNVTFNGNASNDPDGGSIQSWSWDFDDGGTSNFPAPSHVFSSGGTYNVQLTVTDDEGAENTASVSVDVNSPLLLLLRPRQAQAPCFSR